MITIFTDGATEGWNGKLGTVKHCGIGFYCPDTGYEYTERIEAISNNEAEFYALIRGMEWAIRCGYKEVEFRMDSMIAVNRATGKTKLTVDDGRKLKNPKKKTGFQRRLVMDGFQRIIMGMKPKFRVCLFKWIPREENAKADSLSKASLHL